MIEAVQGLLDNAIPATGEAFHELARIGDARVEHIVSSDKPDPAEQVQGWDEWVLVIAGSAVLELAGQEQRMSQGDWLLIPAGTRHRVLATEAGTQWIAVHGRPPRPTD